MANGSTRITKKRKGIPLGYSTKGCFFHVLIHPPLAVLLVLHFKHLTQVFEWKGDKMLEFD